MNTMRRHLVISITGSLALCGLTIEAAQVDPKGIERSADFITQAFMWEISDVPAMCKDEDITPSEFHNEVNSEFLRLVAGKNKKFHLYLTDDISEDREQAIILRFLEEHTRQSSSLDFISSFLVWKLFHARCNEVTTFEDRESYRQIEDEKRIEIKNFCMNALASSRGRREIPAVFPKAKKWMSVDFWSQQSWHNAYLVSSMMPDERLAWWWVNSGILLLQDVATKTNYGLDSICEDLSGLYSSKLTSHNDKHCMYYQLQLARESNRRLETLDKSLIKRIEMKYPGTDWKSPISHAIYWCEYGLSKSKDTESKLQHQLRRCAHRSCIEGRMNIIEDRGAPTLVFLSPNFDMLDITCEMLTDGFYARFIGEEHAKVAAKTSMKQLLLVCHRFRRDIEGKKLYARLKKMFPENGSVDDSYSAYAHKLQRDQLPYPNSIIGNETIRSNLEYGYALIATDNVKDGEGLLRFAAFVLEEGRNLGAYQGPGIDTLKDRVLQYVLVRIPEKYALRLKNWSQNNLQKEFK